MNLKEYLKRRKSMTFTRRQVECLLRKCGYQCKWTNTLVDPDKSTWVESSCGSQTAAQNQIRKRNKGKIPYHFAYIKFYRLENGKGPYALVAGKTNLGDHDFDFEVIEGTDEKLIIAEMGKDKAKAFVGEKAKGRKWHTHRVLVVWHKDQKMSEESDEAANFALTVEADIGGLFGLFKS